MDEIYSDAAKITPKPFFASALILEGIAVVLMLCLLLSLRFLSPRFFGEIRGFYTENICFNAADEQE